MPAHVGILNTPCRYIEQAYNDKLVAVFAQGASGDQNPLYLRAATNALASRSGVTITGNVLTREKIEAPLNLPDRRKGWP